MRLLILMRLWAKMPCPHQVLAPARPSMRVRFSPKSRFAQLMRPSQPVRQRTILRRTFNQVLNRALRERRLLQLDDALDGQIGKTLYAPGGEPVVVRELGPRKLGEVRLSEIRRLVDLLGLDRG